MYVYICSFHFVIQRETVPPGSYTYSKYLTPLFEIITSRHENGIVAMVLDRVQTGSNDEIKFTTNWPYAFDSRREYLIDNFFFFQFDSVLSAGYYNPNFLYDK